ncbi:MAG TPA: YbjQ family protein [Acidilobales archaeon]|nr:YbjQ family protein [Acidilobales archaeon]
MEGHEILLSTTENIPGYKIIKVLGIVMGSAVRARHIGRDIVASLRNIVGGEVREYTELLAQARNIAIERMIKRAKEMGANAVIGVRFSTANIMGGAAEVLAYGTAVVVKKVE